MPATSLPRWGSFAGPVIRTSCLPPSPGLLRRGRDPRQQLPPRTSSTDIHHKQERVISPSSFPASMVPPPKNMPNHQYYMCVASVTHVPMMQKQIPPNIEAYVLPRLEMRFETFKEAKDFYNIYAKHAGFAVREGSKVETRVYLYCTKTKNSRMDDVDDVLKTVNFFREMKAINREFFRDMQLDESDRVKNIFWANASCRGAYQDFGDCIRDEDADSFRWLFKKFLRCMRGKAPTCIPTDQCPAMALAIPDAFKNTVHKLRRWHIMKKYREHLAYMYNLHEDFKDEFTSILNWPLMPTELEAAWKRLMDRYNLHDDATMKEQNTLTFYGFDTQMANLYSRAVYSEIKKRLKLSTHFMAIETEEPTKYLVRYNNPQKLSAWAQHAF
ncbi:protein FAR-RED IMPAIRED RESPONSE 1-like [Aegilops tauschii subsp. strangulata]|uniref:protein FAR-RED IMPAIRED RESPONSE 1-like n=1 Tax=Aegilops tauschii subsp. strangulata TaxID=200361 RepID=UPI000989DC85|nr:protein FAR-RED IMPAIRED RESPONSE 1-like [Aegilops tauschii subsp. strangulata]